MNVFPTARAYMMGVQPNCASKPSKETTATGGCGAHLGVDAREEIL
jgi:hypothetical protein